MKNLIRNYFAPLHPDSFDKPVLSVVERLRTGFSPKGEEMFTKTPSREKKFLRVYNA